MAKPDRRAGVEVELVYSVAHCPVIDLPRSDRSRRGDGQRWRLIYFAEKGKLGLYVNSKLVLRLT